MTRYDPADWDDEDEFEPMYDRDAKRGRRATRGGKGARQVEVDPWATEEDE